jgi:N-acetylneuraminate synthase
LAFKKPGDGIPAFRYAELLGKKLNKNIEKDHKLAWEDIN